MANPVVHFEIIGSNAAQLREFYGRAFGWNVATEPNTGDHYAVVENAGLTGGIGSCPGRDYAGHVTFYVCVDDIVASLQNVERLGGKTVNGPMDLPNGRGQAAHFADPQGHMIGLVQPA